MNRDQKAAVIDKVADEIRKSEAVFAVDYRGISVKQSADLRVALGEADASFRVVKNRLTIRAADDAGAESLKPMLEGPTALTFVRGDVATAAKALATFRREHQLLEFKGGTLNGSVLSAEDVAALSRLPAREQLYGQLVGVIASPVGGLVRTLNALIQGLALQLGSIAEQGLVSGEAPAAAAPAAETTAEEPAAEAQPAEAPGDPAAEAEAEAAPADAGDDSSGDAGPDAPAPSDAPGDPVAEAVAAEEEAPTDDTPSEGNDQEAKEG